VFAGATSAVRVDANGLVIEALVLQGENLKIGDKCVVILRPDRLTLLRQ